MSKSLHEALSEVLNAQAQPLQLAHKPKGKKRPLPKSDLAEEARPLSDISAAGQTLGKVGGKRGGPARAKVLPAARRSEIARQGGLAAHGK